MNRKHAGRKLGIRIRMATGLPLPIAQRIGRLLIRGREETLKTHPLTSPYCKDEDFPCGCCGMRGFTVRGPKGAVDRFGEDIE